MRGWLSIPFSILSCCLVYYSPLECFERLVWLTKIKLWSAGFYVYATDTRWKKSRAENNQYFARNAPCMSKRHTHTHTHTHTQTAAIQKHQRQRHFSVVFSDATDGMYCDCSSWRCSRPLKCVPALFAGKNICLTVAELKMLPAHLEIGHARRRSIYEWAKLCQTRRAESSVVAELKAVEIIVGVEFNAPLDTI